MFKSKSFHLISEDEKRQTEQLYQAKKNCRWLKYIVLPALIGFALLLVLVNVDFTGTAYDVEKPPQTTPVAVTDPPPIQETGIVSRSARASGCYDVNNCLYKCDASTVGTIKHDLETQQLYCSSDLTLILEYCSLPSGRLKSDFLSGSYRLENLTINDCGLETIEVGAFQKASVKGLKVLLLKKSLFINLSADTFVGLSSLQQFVMSNVQRLTGLTATNFLQPLAATVVEVLLQHHSNDGVYDPTPWLGGTANFTQLRFLNMSGNNFANKLKNQTFALMTQLQELYLSYCGLTYIESGTFDPLAPTLRLLDLSHNQLVAINWHFLGSQETLAPNYFHLIVHENLWSCTCANQEMVELIRLSSQNLVVIPQCTSPEELYGIFIPSVTLECNDVLVKGTTIMLQSTTEVVNDTSTIVDSSSDDSSSSSNTSETEETAETDAESTTPIQHATTTTAAPISDDTTGTTVESTTINTTTDQVTTTTTESTTSDSTTTVQTTTFDTTTVQLATTTETTTLDPTTTTSSSAPELTTVSPEVIVVRCPYENSFRVQVLRKYDVSFMILTDSPTSVRLYTQNDLTKLRLVYFNQTSAYNITTRRDVEDPATPKVNDFDHVVVKMSMATKISEIHVDGLQNNRTYVFCLVPREQRTTSPFNCRSHFLYVSNGSMREWLEDDDVAWFVSVVVLSVVVCLLIGLLITYWLLRLRPTWLRGSHGVQPINEHSHQVLVFPAKSRISLEEQYVFSEFIKKHGSISDVYSSENGLKPDSHDYMQFYRNLELSKMKKDATLSLDSRPPEEKAPKVPAHSDTRPISSQTLVRREATIYEDEENQYESVGYYQELY